MAMIGGNRHAAGHEVPRVITIGVSRSGTGSVADDAATTYTVRMHEEGTPVAWRRDVVLRPAARQSMRDDLTALDEWSIGERSDAAATIKTAARLGRRLYSSFLGKDGTAFLDEHRPTALMIDADETALNLPWELLTGDAEPLALRSPFGRIVSTRTRPRPERDPGEEDTTIRVLAVVDPTSEMSHVDAELEAMRDLSDLARLRVDVLRGADATRAALAERVAATAYDVVHFSGHGGFTPRRPGHSGLMLADGPLLTRSILDLPWAKPPYLAIVSACWSGRSAGDRLLTGPTSGSNGVAAAFLSAGASGCLGFGWPVSVRGAAMFVESFYRALAAEQNVGLAVLEARRTSVQRLWSHGDLAGFGAVFYGDVGTAERHDLVTAI